MIEQAFAATIGAAIAAFIYERLSLRGQKLFGIACAIFCVAVTALATIYLRLTTG